ncbi:MAG: peptide-methionine (S)-S-oxide reductase MsrA [Patescibacteria group bacterium]
MPNTTLEIATLSGGCFWCTEAVFQRLKGVESVHPGYTGGTVKDPTYDDVSMGDSGHAESVQITFDPSVISYDELLDVFFHLHDPTTLNRQGADVGTQYRSAIFYANEEQKKIAEAAIKKVDAAHAYPDPVVTELTPLTEFYSAEKYHENYYNSNRAQGYCKLVIDPKIQKLYKTYADKVK